MQEVKDLKKGDEVIVYDGGGVPRRRVVGKVLTKIIIVDGCRYWISTGRPENATLGGSIDTPERHDHFIQVAAARKLLESLSNSSYDIPHPKLLAIYKCLSDAGLADVKALVNK